MAILIDGQEFNKLADTLYAYKRECECREVCNNPEYKKLGIEEDNLISEIEQVLPDDIKNKLSFLLEDIEVGMSSFWDKHTYKQAFFDGMTVMQALIYKTHGKSVSSEIVRLLDDHYYRDSCQGGQSVKEVRGLLQEIQSMIVTMEQLDGIALDLCRGKS